MGHLQHFFKIKITNIQSLELMEPLIFDYHSLKFIMHKVDAQFLD